MRQDREAILKFLKKPMRRYGRPVEIVSDNREMGWWINNRAENSHLPYRRRERAMLRFRRMRSLPQCMARFTITSIGNALATPEKISRPTVPLLWSSGAAPLWPETAKRVGKLRRVRIRLTALAQRFYPAARLSVSSGCRPAANAAALAQVVAQARSAMAVP